MSDQQTQPTSGETGTLGAGPAAPDMPAPNEPVTAAAEVEAASLAPEQEETSPKPDAPKVDAVKAEAPKVEAAKAEASKAEPPKVEAPKIDAVKPEAPRFPGKVMIMSPGDRVGRRRQGCAGGGIVRQAPVRGDGGRGGAGDGGGCAGWRAGNRWRWKADGRRTGAESSRRRQRTARSKPRWRGSMPRSSR